MKTTRFFIAIALLVLAFAGCKKDNLYVDTTVANGLATGDI